jgi:hypothetical protein
MLQLETEYRVFLLLTVESTTPASRWCLLECELQRPRITRSAEIATQPYIPEAAVVLHVRAAFPEEAALEAQRFLWEAADAAQIGVSRVKALPAFETDWEEEVLVRAGIRRPLWRNR